MKTYTDLSQALKEQDKVQVLDLSNQGLTEIPVEILRLTNLTILNLAYNQIETIPPEIGCLMSSNDTPPRILSDKLTIILPPSIISVIVKLSFILQSH